MSWNIFIFFFGNIFFGLLARPLWDLLNPYQQNRVLTFIYPDKDPLGAAYQIIQSKTAIGSGGLLGKGWGQGTQTHLKFLPVQESDFILSVIGEELGFLWICILIIIFVVFIWRGYWIAWNALDSFGKHLAFGSTTIISLQIILNIFVVVGLLPTKGWILATQAIYLCLCF